MKKRTGTRRPFAVNPALTYPKYFRIMDLTLKSSIAHPDDPINLPYGYEGGHCDHCLF